ncbi:MAG: hypothetical protein KAW41_03435 [Candidatus Diapherotrites archaeon]|nr:hypothetical protein [Candidatus Diapherotrites archaeon]
MPKKTMLVTRPNHDHTVHFLKSWNNRVITEGRKHGFKVIDLVGDRANKEKVDQVIQKRDPRFIVFNGHGSPSQITGQRGEVLVDSKTLGSELKSRVISALACDSGRELGPKSVKKGADGFIGYEDEFVFLSDHNYESRPEQDPLVKPFRDSAIKPVISLIKGNTLEEAYNSSQDRYRDWIRYYWANASANPNAPHILEVLLWDMAIQTHFGAPNTKL